MEEQDPILYKNFMHIFVCSMQALEWSVAMAAIFNIVYLYANIVYLYASQPAVLCLSLSPYYFDILWYRYIVIQQVNVAKKGSDRERDSSSSWN